MNNEYTQKQGIDWTEQIYRVFLILVIAGFFYWTYWAHKNSPCNQDPIPQEYYTQCKYGYK